MPNNLFKMLISGENGLMYHYTLMKWLTSCSLEEYRYFAKLDYYLRKQHE